MRDTARRHTLRSKHVRLSTHAHTHITTEHSCSYYHSVESRREAYRMNTTAFACVGPELLVLRAAARQPWAWGRAPPPRCRCHWTASCRRSPPDPLRAQVEMWEKRKAAKLGRYEGVRVGPGCVDDVSEQRGAAAHDGEREGGRSCDLGTARLQAATPTTQCSNEGLMSAHCLCGAATSSSADDASASASPAARLALAPRPLPRL